MPWSGGAGAGFTSARPWMRLGPDIATRNVERQLADPDSILRLYQRLLRARRSTPALSRGDLEVLPSPGPGVLAYRRRAGESEAVVVVNFSKLPVRAGIDLGSGGRWRSLVATHLGSPAEFEDGGLVTLAGLGGAVFVPDPGPGRRATRTR